MSSSGSTELSLEQIGVIYAGFMEEIKIRLGAVEHTVAQIYENPDNSGNYILAESCYLQLRFVAELIALAALVAHSEISEATSNKLTGDWNADAILNRLGHINGYCYPTPVEPSRNPETGHLHFELVESGYLTRSDLRALYHSCGENLHRGILKHLIDGKNKRYDIPQLKGWAEAIERLLRTHVVMLPALKGTMVIEMTGENGNVAWHYAATSNGGDYSIAFPPTAG